MTAVFPIWYVKQPIEVGDNKKVLRLGNGLYPLLSVLPNSS